MATKKTTAVKTTTQPKPKYYIVMDTDQEIVCQGDWNEVKDALEEIMAGNSDRENKEIISDFTLYELGAGKSIKYIPQVPASVSL